MCGRTGGSARRRRAIPCAIPGTGKRSQCRHMRLPDVSSAYLSATARRADRQCGEPIDRVAAGAPVRKLLVIEAFGHVRVPFAGYWPDHRAGVELAAIGQLVPSPPYPGGPAIGGASHSSSDSDSCTISERHILRNCTHPTEPMAMANTPVTPASISPSISISPAMTAKSATMGLRRMSPAITEATIQYRIRFIQLTASALARVIIAQPL
jgi:hypothetical protein